MKIKTHNYYTYILTNKNKTVLYIGVTNNIYSRLYEHKNDSEREKKTFAGKYNCIYLVNYKCFEHIQDAIKREKELKGWTRAKKEILIETTNKNWSFLNDEIR